MAPLKKPLYRKVNTTARRVMHVYGGAFSDERNTQQQTRFDGVRQSMHGKQQLGLDYTPLFRFLLSKVGKLWDDVYAEAVGRSDKAKPVFWLVALHEHERKPYVRVGESSYYIGMYVADDGTLQIVDPSIDASTIVPWCKCCTHTFNGTRFYQPFPE